MDSSNIFLAFNSADGYYTNINTSILCVQALMLSTYALGMVIWQMH